MPQEKDSHCKNPSESFGEIIKEFGEAISKIFNDPEVKEKAEEFVKSAAKSAESFSNRCRDEEVQAKFRDVGNAAQEFGKNLAYYFKDDKDK